MAKLSGSNSSNASSRTLQLSFSQWEKAKTLSEECTRARDAGRIDDARYHTLQDFYIRHMQRAREKVEFLRTEHRVRAEALRKELQDTARRQAQLSDKVSARELTPEKANRLNQELVAAMSRLRERFLEEDKLANAQSAADVGGLVDLPLEDYAKPVGGTFPRLSLARMAGTVVPVLAGLAVFLPWLNLDGNVVSLGDIGASIQAASDLQGIDWVRALVVGGTVLPLVGAMFTWIERRRIGGYGLVVVGLLMLTLALTAIGAVGNLLNIGSYRAGALGYVAAGVILAGIGVGRLRAVETTTWSMRRGVVAAVLALVALAAVGWFMLNVDKSASKLHIVFGEFDAATQSIPIRIANSSDKVATLYTPWPQGVPGGPLVEDEGSAFGVAVYVRETDASKYRLLPDSHDCWRYTSRASALASPIELPPNGREEIDFRVSGLDNLEIHPTAVRIVFSNGRGSTLAETELALPQG